VPNEIVLERLGEYGPPVLVAFPDTYDDLLESNRRWYGFKTKRKVLAELESEIYQGVIDYKKRKLA
jgi:hypothetical protein